LDTALGAVFEYDLDSALDAALEYGLDAWEF
jgi:hypothetical protein